MVVWYTRCYRCNEKAKLYRCKHCEKYFCSEHFNPEDHACYSYKQSKNNEEKNIVKRMSEAFDKWDNEREKRVFHKKLPLSVRGHSYYERYTPIDTRIKRTSLWKIKSHIKSWIVLIVILSPLLYFFVIPFVNGMVCSVYAGFPYICPITFTISVDKSTMANYDSIALQDAMNQWEKATNNAMKFEIVDYSLFGFLANSHVTWNSNTLSGNEAGLEETTSGVIWIWIFPIPYRFRTVTISSGYEPCQEVIISIHEIGHALGLGHSTDPSSVMYPTAGCGQRITSKDAQDVINKARFGFIL